MLVAGVIYVGTGDPIYDGQAPRNLRPGAISGPDPELLTRLSIRYPIHSRGPVNGERPRVSTRQSLP